MATPIYRLTVCAPRSVDSTEATALSPIGSAPHADAFKIASATGVSGFQPYLDTVRGRRGRIDPLTRKTDTGQLVVRCMDKRLDPSDNLERWVTAFFGDSEGKARLIGRKVLVEESTDGSSWSPFFTGRIQDVRLASRVWVELVLRDMAEEQDRDIFVGRPHSSITYAQVPPLIPNGLVSAYGSMPTVAKLSGRVSTESGTFSISGGRTHAKIEITARTERQRAVATATLDKIQRKGTTDAPPPARVVLTAGATTGEFELYPVRGVVHAGLGYRTVYFDLERDNDLRLSDDDPGKYVVRSLGIQEVASTDAGYMAMPAAGTSVTFHVVETGPPGEATPLLIDDVHPVQIWKDLLDGKFSRLASDGSVLGAIAYDSAAFAALIADTTFGTARFSITETAVLNEWVEEHVCVPFNLAYRLDAEGRVVPIDMRRPSTLPTSTTIADADLDTSEAPGWSLEREGAITRVTASFYADRQITLEEIKADRSDYPNLPASLILSSDQIYEPADFANAADLGDRPMELDAQGYRATVGFRGKSSQIDADSQARIEKVQRRLGALVEELRGPFGQGAQIATLVCRRTANTSTCQPGDWRIIDVDPLPDPASNTRGGNRLMRCIERTEDGPVIRFGFLDAGPGAVATSPTLGAIAVDSTGERPAVTVAVTLNAQSEAVALEFAVTSTATGTRPAETSDLWTYGGRATTAGTARIENLPEGRRVWVRGRTAPGEANAPRLPSAWVFPNAPGYADTTGKARAAVVDLSINALTGEALVTWENDDSFDGARIYYGLHADPDDPPALTDYVDQDATEEAHTLEDVTVRPGESITIEFEPWTGWTGSAVSGTAGARVAITQTRTADLSSYSINNLRRVPTDAVGKARFQGMPGALIEPGNIWSAYRRYPAPPSEDHFEAVRLLVMDGLWTELESGEVWIEVDEPGADEVGYLWAEPRYEDADGNLVVYPGDVIERVEVFPIAPLINGWVDARYEAGLVNVYAGCEPTVSALPVRVQVYEGAQDGTLLASYLFTEAGEVGPSDHSELGSRTPAATGKKTWWAKFTDRAGNIKWEHDSLEAPANPKLGALRYQQGATPLTADLYLPVESPVGRPLTLRAWVNKSITTNPDSSASPDSTLAMTFTPGTPGTSEADPADTFANGQQLMNEVAVFPGVGKVVAFEAVDDLGFSSGKQAFTIYSWSTLQRADGTIINDAVDRPGAIAASFAPILRVSALPASGTRTDERVFLTTTKTLYKWNGASWVTETPGVGAYSFLPVVVANSISAEEIAAFSITTGKLNVASVFVSGMTTLNNSPGAGSIAWSGCTVVYEGASYSVTGGSTTGAIIWWDRSSPNAFRGSTDTDDLIADGFSDTDGDAVILLNESGTARQIWNGTLIYGGIIKVPYLSAIKADLGTMSAGLLNNATSSPDAGIRLSSGYSKPGTWTRYIDFAATSGQVLLDLDDLVVTRGVGSVFSGEVASDTFTATTASFSNAIEILGAARLDLNLFSMTGPFASLAITYNGGLPIFTLGSTGALTITGDMVVGEDLGVTGEISGAGGTLHVTSGLSVDETTLTIKFSNGTVVSRRVVVGAPDSGGSGYRMLRITN